MNDYVKLLAASFVYPNLNNQSKLNKRTSSLLELFFDLIFVALFGLISHLFIDVSILHVLLSMTLFAATFLIWSNLNMYMMYFYCHSYLVRFGVLTVMLTLFFVAAINNVAASGAIRVITLSILLSRLALILLFYITIMKNKKINNENFKMIYKKRLSINLIACFIGTVPFFLGNLSSLIIFILLSVVYELKSYKQLNNNSFMPKIDYKLIHERNLLFLGTLSSK